jgi:dTDP-4-amino-4,6-dideoxygalactose transaminase
MSKIPFNRPIALGAELGYIRQAIDNGHLSGGGPFTELCNRWLEDRFGSQRALLTHSCTAALELAAMLLRVGPGDEVVMPSFTFVSTANAFVLRGAKPVFVDIREDTLNLDVRELERAITDRTRAIVPVHYAGAACDMTEVLRLANAAELYVVEDAAQGLCATYRGRELGSIGDLGALSFHETKNVIAGEGGALLINDDRFVARAEVLLEKGTDRRSFFRGEVDKYTWVDVGSSYAPSEIIAAFLWAQLEHADQITRRRRQIWERYHLALREAEQAQLVRRPIVSEHSSHNAHMYYVLLPDERRRDRFIEDLASAGIHSVFHYVPLHSSRAGRRYGRAVGSLRVTDEMSRRLVRLPLWGGMDDVVVDRVIDAVSTALGTHAREVAAGS